MSNQRFYYLAEGIDAITDAECQVKILRTARQILAERSLNEKTINHFLLTDASASVLGTRSSGVVENHSFSPYGYANTLPSANTRLGYNGEFIQGVSGHYLLGTGYHRAYSPAVMRFNSPDNWSPFGKGGINTYAYCNGDPVNNTDPSGHYFLNLNIFKFLSSNFRPARLIFQSSTTPITNFFVNGKKDSATQLAKSITRFNGTRRPTSLSNPQRDLQRLKIAKNTLKNEELELSKKVIKLTGAELPSDPGSLIRDAERIIFQPMENSVMQDNLLDDAEVYANRLSMVKVDMALIRAARTIIKEEYLRR
jgi:RHS repeat-associated protein